ncbi:hypothetical protein FGIG_04983 [Fasciola gigantica]|uniref:Uncharacterized protein n=1 Tax=Fasciola gigantica TaxID=46835 RepID=A0A504Z840_FASGI|nr:hypothetical protein FGIG_04983 [Fasciola gigantica]
MLKFSFLFAFLALLAVLSVCDAQSSSRQRVIYRGPQSYAGYRFRKTPGRPAVPPRTYYKPKPIDDVKLYGRKRNDPTYRQGLSEFAGLMDMD